MSCKGAELGHMLLLNIDRKAYLESVVAITFDLSDIERSRSRSLRFQRVKSRKGGEEPYSKIMKIIPLWQWEKLSKWWPIKHHRSKAWIVYHISNGLFSSCEIWKGAFELPLFLPALCLIILKILLAIHHVPSSCEAILQLGLLQCF